MRYVMKEFQQVGVGSTSHLMSKNDKLSVEEFRPLEDRMAGRPVIAAGLANLKLEIGAEAFDRFINPLSNINKGEDSLLVMANTEQQRTMLMRDYLPALSKAFGVAHVQVVGSGKDAF